jgi:hypothetical protein
MKNLPERIALHCGAPLVSISRDRRFKTDLSKDVEKTCLQHKPILNSVQLGNGEMRRITVMSKSKNAK